MKKILLSFLLMTWAYIDSSCQVVINQEYFNKLFKARVNNIDEFMDRFNGDKFHLSIDTTKADCKILNIISLFNAEGLEGNQEALSKIEAFAEKALASGAKLHYEDSLWFAMAPCHGKYKGTDVEFILWLNVEHRRGEMYKWVIAKASGDIFKLTPSIENEQLMISPVEHDINFMQLGRITTETDDLILNYKQKQFTLDETSVFFTLVNQGLLDIEYVYDLQFVFMQVPGYQIVIKDFDRLTANSGWLIKDIIPISDKDKQAYLDFVYNRPKCDGYDKNVSQCDDGIPTLNNQPQNSDVDSATVAIPEIHEVDQQQGDAENANGKKKKKEKNK